MDRIFSLFARCNLFETLKEQSEEALAKDKESPSPMSLAQGDFVKAEFEPLFPPKRSPEEIANILQIGKIVLGEVKINNHTICGDVYVSNSEDLNKKAKVVVRYTADKWQTAHNTDAFFMFANPTSNVYCFSIFATRDAKEIEFAVVFRSQWAEYWDNNNSKNYHLRRVEEEK